MKYTWTIIGAAAFWTILGLIAAWGAAAYCTSDSRSFKEPMYFFTMFPLGGLVAGLVVGCAAAWLNHTLRGEPHGKAIP